MGRVGSATQFRSCSSLILLIGIIDLDPWLEPFREAIQRRYKYVESWINTVDETEGGLDKFSKVGSNLIDLFNFIDFGQLISFLENNRATKSTASTSPRTAISRTENGLRMPWKLRWSGTSVRPALRK
jgi:hypothetical protein